MIHHNQRIHGGFFFQRKVPYFILFPHKNQIFCCLKSHDIFVEKKPQKLRKVWRKIRKNCQLVLSWFGGKLYKQALKSSALKGCLTYPTLTYPNYLTGSNRKKASLPPTWQLRHQWGKTNTGRFFNSVSPTTTVKGRMSARRPKRENFFRSDQKLWSKTLLSSTTMCPRASET